MFSVLAAASAIASAGAAQVAVNRNARYLFAADPGDARSNWVNPGALGLLHTLSVYADFTLGLEPPYETGSPVSQISLGLNSHFLALAYQFDRMPDPLDPLGRGTVRGHAVRVTLWGQDGRVGAGGATTWYSGGDGGVAFDFGVVYRATRLLDLGGVLANVGQPSVRGTELAVRMRPAITLHSPQGDVALQGQGDIGTRRLFGFAVGAKVSVPGAPLPIHLTARLDADGTFRRESFTFGVFVGGESRGAAVMTAGGDLREPDAASLHFASERSNQPTRGRR